MRTRNLLALVFFLAVPFAGCGGTSGGECDKCTSDDSCKAGLVCSTFDDGSKRCGSGVGTTSCRVH